MKLKFSKHSSLLIAAGLSALVLTGCEAPLMDTEQVGFRGVGMEAVVNPRIQEDIQAVNIAPEPIPAIPPGGPKASEIYQNVQILGDLDVGQFNRLMTAITAWVSPEQGCNYCHEAADLASDALYTKRVARVMIAMTQRANQDWQAHVKDTGVTCYTCHRGQAVPAEVWATEPAPRMVKAMVPTGQNVAGVETVAYSSLPYDPLTPYLSEAKEIRVAADTALPEKPGVTTKETEWTYALMMHLSNSLGVNCTHCHNSRAFSDWEQSPDQRLQAWYAIRQVREMNNVFIHATTDILPDSRKGPLGDPLKVNCKTCHQGVNKPLYGAPMLKDYPSLATLSGKAKEAASVEQAAAKAAE